MIPMERLRWWFPLAAIWGPVLWRMSTSWLTDEEMMHGWVVPILVIYLVRQRLRDVRFSTHTQNPSAVFLLAAAVLGEFAGFMIWESNQIWPRVMWFTTGCAILATLSLVARSAGWREARSWMGIVALMALALPWPTAIQQPITLGLFSFNAQVAAELVSALGHPAALTGRVIEVADGLVGIEEACSGIRSLQTVTMAGIFLAVIFNLGWSRGIRLLTAGWLVAMTGNLVRTCYLTHVLSSQGHAEMNAVHDAAGEVVLAATLIILAGIAWRMPRQLLVKSNTASVPVDWLNRLSARVAIATGSFLVMAEVGVQFWYARSIELDHRIDWEWVDRPDGREVEVPDYARQVLGYSEGGGWSHRDPITGVDFLSYRFIWSADERYVGGCSHGMSTQCGIIA